uniref:EscR/YscR/HrcR family type III secretion system export apparatus protein n=1 Tax=Robbsia andropogonis TaxID=28092 RepID=UPI000467C458|nr:EscR/YscR/HrcR family type III secretion system export apparatus protein [Robbsia andropogonis]
MSNLDPIALALILASLTLVPTLAVVSTSFLKISVVMLLVRNALGVQQAPPNVAIYGMALILSAYVMAPVGARIYDAVMTTLPAGTVTAFGPAAPAGMGANVTDPRNVDANGGRAPSMSAPPQTVNGYGAASPQLGRQGGAQGMAPGVSRQATSSQGTGISLDGLMRAVAAGGAPFKAFLIHNSRPEHRTFFVDTARRMWTGTMAADVAEDDLLVLIPAFVLSEMDAAFKMGFLLYLPFVLIDLIVSNVLLAMGMMMVSPVTISLPLKLFLFVMVNGWTRLIQGLVLSYL